MSKELDRVVEELKKCYILFFRDAFMKKLISLLAPFFQTRIFRNITEVKAKWHNLSRMMVEYNSDKNTIYVSYSIMWYCRKQFIDKPKLAQVVCGVDCDSSEKVLVLGISLMMCQIFEGAHLRKEQRNKYLKRWLRTTFGHRDAEMKYLPYAKKYHEFQQRRLPTKKPVNA